MDAPDYTRYTEFQLRQVLRDIDAQRFPERLQEIRQWLAHFEQAKKALMPATQTRRLISRSPSRRFMRWHLLVFLAVSLVAAVSTWFYPARWEVLTAVAVVAAAAALLGAARMAALQLQVFDCGDGLGFKHKDLEAYAAWRDIDRIELGRSEDQEWLVLHLKFESVFGETIEFFASAAAPDARTLRDQLSKRIAGH
ncbi:hypothetical protein GJ698_28695 [Pseudoduganella sp. FT26W]|uniref:Uncharacterized protein n=1 Tax=Duganella aquatilis TaxID=2666082 RepID=A0A844DAI7_9BURK|nr:hypothetical protein [Duganella aquatilis]MRW88061.1 hypothetical protein [Duganella aquatilis]